MEATEYIHKFIIDLFSILGEMSPFLLLGFFFAGVLYAFMPRQKIERYFNGNPYKSSIYAALLGVPLPLCSCGVIPTGAALYKNGASKGGTVSFLISTPQTGVDSVLATFSLLGLPFAIIRPIAALITGITGGIITSKLTPKETATIIEEKEQKKSFADKVKATFQYGFIEFVQDIAKWLVLGLLLAAIISALIPDDFFELINLPPYLQMLLILIVSIPLYICATGTIPLAAVLILKGISPGAAFVLLMAGPATNAATITMIGKILGRKSLVIYLSVIILGALTFGLLIDYVLPAEWFLLMVEQHSPHQHIHGLSWIEIASAITLTGLIINAFIKRYRSPNKDTTTPTNTTTMNDTTLLKVNGMTCNHCKANVESNLEKLDFITSAQVNLSEKSVTIQSNNLDMDKVISTIESIGYTCPENTAH